MSTKTIAVDAQVYERLAGLKREGESFSKAIDRLMDEVGAAHTGAHVLLGLADQASLPPEEAERFLEVVRRNRESERWEPHDLS